MFIDTETLPFLKNIANSSNDIYEELVSVLSKEPEAHKAIHGEMVMDFPSNQWAWESGINRERVGYDLRDGNFSMYAIYKKTGNEVTLDRTSLFPKTMSLLSSFDNPHYIAFNFLHPGSHLKPHSHIRKHYVYHLLLQNLTDGNCEMICGKERKYLKAAGDHLMFDYSQIHETFHRASNVRINLMVDFLPESRL
ncbi:aspartyl/asparaginyl beta-hydroxylase domain-containing protein [Alcanivorax quisquiliarum]|uniref:Aspartyl/asparaginyl beta-hydroxylase domain-containing protein n=1 Tax=Alcanivorax quisquiliarum TaxID=2933565 RepID=A0ABT0E3H8_9GAMM|nr:aspartyl/asparaginyl beta-hydroxylase domain-containing protein [Alcanivorax quisquiliarum]MCK0536380.1 aspartyl/asparaginyl beta-hydroxylase domain-containing protein [Alcanivorax quisquiliarum]